MEHSYLFYDIETTGLNKCFDQVLQFAAIRTDLQLNELERHEIHLSLNPDVIPAPAASITHRMSLPQMLKGAQEIEGIQQIHRLLNKPNTISLGYNTLAFDDEFLRFSFYRNLLPPYTHQYANQCSRMDIYPMTIIYYLFDPGVLQWPKINGKVSLKLENLTKANKLAQGKAHHAMVDVEATLALAKRLYKNKKMWDYLLDHFNKKINARRLSQLNYSFSIDQQHYQEGVIVDSKIGPDLNFIAPVVGLGQHYHYKNQNLWLRLDLDNLSDTTANTINENTYIIRTRLSEQQIILPTKPRYLEKIKAAKLAKANENKAWLQKNSDLFHKICKHHQHYKYPTVSNVDIDAALYNINFPTQEEERAFREFHLAKAEQKESLATLLHSPIRKEQAFRILGRHYPQYLSTENKCYLDSYINSISSSENTPIDYLGNRHLTPQTALDQIEELNKQQLDKEQRQLLKELKDHIIGKWQTATALVE